MKWSFGFKLSIALLACVAIVVLIGIPETSMIHRAWVVERPEPQFGPMHYLREVKERGQCGAYYGTLRNVPSEMLTSYVCLEGIRQCDLPETLKNCPKRSISHEVALEAAKRRMNLTDMPVTALDNEVVRAYVKSGGLLYQVPERLQTHELYLASVAARPENIKWVPENKLDRKMIWSAVIAEPTQLANVPQHLITCDLVREAVRRDWQVLRYVPATLMDETLYLAALQQDGRALGYVPFEDRSLELCRLALSKTNESWEFVPHRFLLPDQNGQHAELAQLLAR